MDLETLCFAIFMVLSVSQTVYGSGIFEDAKDSNTRVRLTTNDTLNLMKCSFPEYIHIKLHSLRQKDHVPVSFRLEKQQMSHQFPVTFLISSLSVHRGERHSSINKNTMASYTSRSNDVHIIFDCKMKSNISTTGVVLHNGEEYSISTSEGATSDETRHGHMTVVLTNVPVSKMFHDYIRSEKSKDLTDILLNRPLYGRRHRRDASYSHDVTSFTIDVMVVVDRNVFEKWLSRVDGLSQRERVENAKREIQKYYMHVIHGVDHRYKQIGFNDFQIAVKLSGIVLVDREILTIDLNITQDSMTSLGKNAIEADVALRDFRSWINDTEGLPEHDHAILFTGYDLYSTTDDARMIAHTSGLAFIGTLCEADESLSIVEEQGGFQSIGTSAHEIGHSLGALHDGENNTCHSEDRYIMAASGFGPVPEAKQYNPWFFSDCSVEYFREFIATLLADGSSCLAQSNTSHATQSSQHTRNDVSKSRALGLPGLYYSPDEQCRMIWGPKSYLCRGAEFGNASTICTAMYCRDPSSVNDCVLHTAARGTTCGNKKWCIHGMCEYSLEAPVHADSCVLGDQPGLAFNEQTCEQLVEQSPSYCYQDKVRARCCRSCGLHNTHRYGCEFGDRIQGCKRWHCNHFFESRNIRSECCGTCETGTIMPRPSPTTAPKFPSSVPNFPTRLPTSSCVDSNLIPGQTCNTYIQRHGAFVCYSKTVVNTCCQTCLKIRQDIDGCEYGDKVPSLCKHISNKTTPYCSDHWNTCCNSCVTKAGRTEPLNSSNKLQCNIFIFIFIYLFKIYISKIELLSVR